MSRTDGLLATSNALAEPTAKLGTRSVLLLGLTNLGMWMAVLTPIQILLPQQIQEIDPTGKVGALGWVTTCAAIGAMIACPVAGALSDRTTSRFGRRHPWILGSAVVIAIALAVQSQQHTVVGVGVCWIVVQVGINAMNAALASVVPDRVPVSQRGVVSAVVGIPMPLALVIGSALVTMVVHGTVAGYLLLAVMVIALTLPFVLSTSDTPLRAEQRPPFRLKAFWISPRKHPDFAWAAGGRFAIQLCNSVGTLYLLYYLGDVVHAKNPAQSVFELILVYTAGILLTSVLAGRLSDRSGKRKVFVIASSAAMGIAMLVLVFGHTMTAALLAAAVLGLGYGVYVSIDQALITEVLPAARSRAKDLGVINLANSAPQAFAPAIAAGVITALHSYSVLYTVAAVVAVIGAALIQPIRSVR